MSTEARNRNRKPLRVPRTGCPEIDRGIRRILTLSDDLLSAERGGSWDPQLLRNLLGRLHDHVSVVFTTEDDLIDFTDFPNAETHKRAHRSLLKHIASFINDIRDGEQLDPRYVRAWMAVWVAKHIKHYDLSLAHHLRRCDMPLPVQEEGNALTRPKRSHSHVHARSRVSHHNTSRPHARAKESRP